MTIPMEIIEALEAETNGLPFGVVSLEIHLHDGRLSRYIVGRTRSTVPGTHTSGEGRPRSVKTCTDKVGRMSGEGEK